MTREKIDNLNPDEKLIDRAVDILRAGGVLVFPTETAYGLAADATNEAGIRKIYDIKGRSFKKFLPLIAADVEQIEKYFKLNQRELELIKRKGISVVLEIRKQRKKGIKGIYSNPSRYRTRLDSL